MLIPLPVVLAVEAFPPLVAAFADPELSPLGPAELLPRDPPRGEDDLLLRHDRGQSGGVRLRTVHEETLGNNAGFPSRA